MSNLLQHLKDTEYQGVKELADAAERFLREAGPVHTKGTVAEYPNERTVRYYMSSGLLTSASEKRGLKSVFGYEHLLKLLTIKKLQADGLPISVIKDLISDKSIEDLEKLFGEEIRVFNEREALESFQQAMANPESAEFAEFNIAACEEPPAEAQKSKAREYLESLLMKPKAPSEDRPDIAFSLPARKFQTSLKSKQSEPPAEPGTWKRYEVAPGLELHARDDFRAPRDIGVLMQLLEKILRKLNSK